MTTVKIIRSEVVVAALALSLVWGVARADTKPEDGKIGDEKALEAPPPDPRQFSLSGTLTAATDYVYRGLSLTRGGPAIQGSLTLRHESGLFAGISSSNVDLGAGGNIEVDGSLGYFQEPGAFSYGVGVNYYGYPKQLKGSQLSYFEFGSTVGYTLDNFKFSGQFYLSPNTAGSQGGLSYYLGAGAAYSATDDLVFAIGVGRSMYQMSGGYDDYLASVSYSWTPVTLELKYTGTAPRIDGIGGSRVTASITYTF